MQPAAAAAPPGDRRPSGSSNFQLVSTTAGSTQNGAERSTGQLRMTLKRKSPVRDAPRPHASGSNGTSSPRCPSDSQKNCASSTRDDAGKTCDADASRNACDEPGCTCKSKRKQRNSHNTGNTHGNTSQEAASRNANSETKVSSGTLTEPQYFGPSEPGTQVNLGAEVWLDADGFLSLSVTWRGRPYAGVLLDTDRLGWAPPQVAAPVTDEPGRPPRGGRKRRAAQSPFCSSLAARRPSAGANRPPARRTPAGRNCTPTNIEPCLDDSNSQQSSASSAPDASPPPTRANAADEDDNLFYCTQPGCMRRYRNAAALRHHHAHAHTPRSANSPPPPAPVPAPAPPADSNVPNEPTASERERECEAAATTSTPVARSNDPPRPPAPNASERPANEPASEANDEKRSQRNDRAGPKPPKRRKRASGESPDTAPPPAPEPLASDGNVHSPAYSDISDTPTAHGEPDARPATPPGGLFGVSVPPVPVPVPVAVPVVAPASGISVIIGPPPGPTLPSPSTAAFLVGCSTQQDSPPLFNAQATRPVQPRACGASPLLLAPSHGTAPFACVKQPKAAAIVTPIFKPNEPPAFTSGGRRSASPASPAPSAARKSDASQAQANRRSELPERASGSPTLLKPAQLAAAVRDENAARPHPLTPGCDREQPPTFGISPQPKPFMHGMLPIPLSFVGAPNAPPPDASLAALMQLAAPIDKNVLAYVSANLAGPPGAQSPGTLPPASAMQLRDLQAVFSAHIPGFALPK